MKIANLWADLSDDQLDELVRAIHEGVIGTPKSVDVLSLLEKEIERRKVEGETHNDNSRGTLH